MAVAAARAGSVEALNARLSAMSPEQLYPSHMPRQARVRPKRIPPSPEQIAALESLLANLRAKAIELSGSDHAHADDLVQDTLERFWERGIRSTSAEQLKHWLRKVIRSLHIEYLEGSQQDFFLTLPGEREEQLEPDVDDLI